MEDLENIYTSGVCSNRKDLFTCRICLGENIKDLSNPVISPCKCNGSMKYIHLECLKPWIKQNLNITETIDSTIIYWKSLSCELCKAPYPFAIYFNGKIFELINHKPPPYPYVIFEHKIKESSDADSLFIINFAIKKTFRIGRHNENEIKLNDVSVSRHQARLYLENGEIYLANTNVHCSASLFDVSVSFSQ